MNPTHPNKSSLKPGNNVNNKSTKSNISKLAPSKGTSHETLFRGNATGNHVSGDYGIQPHLANRSVPQETTVPQSPGGQAPYKA